MMMVMMATVFHWFRLTTSRTHIVCCDAYFFHLCRIFSTCCWVHSFERCVLTWVSICSNASHKYYRCDDIDPKLLYRMWFKHMRSRNRIFLTTVHGWWWLFLWRIGRVWWNSTRYSHNILISFGVFFYTPSFVFLSKFDRWYSSIDHRKLLNFPSECMMNFKYLLQVWNFKPRASSVDSQAISTNVFLLLLVDICDGVSVDGRNIN